MIMKVKVNETVFSVIHYHIHHSRRCQCVSTTRDVNRPFRLSSETHASTRKTEEVDRGRGGKGRESLGEVHGHGGRIRRRGDRTVPVSRQDKRDRIHTRHNNLLQKQSCQCFFDNIVTVKIR